MDRFPTGPNLDTFLATFGKPEDVRREVEEYWTRADASPYPREVFKYLMDKRADAGTITRERANFLSAYFAESFTTEPTTDYIPKHREPLIREFVDWYVTKFKNPVFRIEADIMNLGGLNRDLTEKGPGNEHLPAGVIKPGNKHLADAVIRLMSNVVREHLKPFGDLCAIRSGGDELGIFLRSNDASVNVAQINAALNNAQHEIAEFIQSAGLTDVQHMKKSGFPGVGIGCAAIKLEPGQSKTAQDGELQTGIKTAKAYFANEFLGVGEQPGARMDPATIIALFGQEGYKRYLYPRLDEGSVLRDQKEYRGANPEAARIGRLERHMTSLNVRAISPEERGLLAATSALTIKRDHVTGLPWFSDMKRDLIPNFLAEHCKPDNKKITLVHFDFNNMGGANALGPRVGDAMGRQFATSIQEALGECKLGKFQPFLTSQGGGKFAMLLPSTIELASLQKLLSCVKRKLSERWSVELPLTQEEFAQSHALMLQQPDIYHYAPTMQAITVGDIYSSKLPRYNGAYVMGSFTEIDGERPHLGQAISTLEKEVKRGHSRNDKLVKDRGTMVRAYVTHDSGSAPSHWQSRVVQVNAAEAKTR